MSVQNVLPERRAQAQLPALPSIDLPVAVGEPVRGPMILVINPLATGLDRDAVAATLEHLHAQGRVGLMFEAQPANELPLLARFAAGLARAECGALIAVGGDGTVAAVAKAAWLANCPMAVLPMGERNRFATRLGLSASPAEAADTWLGGHVTNQQLGLVDGNPFVNELSLQPWPTPDFWARARAALPPELRGGNWWSRFEPIWPDADGLHLSLRLDDETCDLSAPSLRILNNPLLVRELGLPEARLVGQGQLLAVAPSELPGGNVLPLAGRVPPRFRKLFHELHLSCQPFLSSHYLQMRGDGELLRLGEQFDIAVARRPLQLLRRLAP